MGRSGDAFDQEVVVGYIYMMKLGHLVADKIHAPCCWSLFAGHATATGRQSAVWADSGSAKMEVWALEGVRRGLQPFRNC